MRGFLFLCFFLLAGALPAQITNYPYLQDFETTFSASGTSVDFYENWWGNETTTGTSRIFRAATEGRSGAALAVQTISTFNGDIRISMDLSSLCQAGISFWAKTNVNGTGSRPVTLRYSFSLDNGNTFGSPVQIGDESTFPNANTSYAQYSLEIPESVQGQAEVVLRLEILYGAGSGSSARWFMDDFEIAEQGPKLLSVAPIANNQLELEFSCDLDPSTMEDVLNYEINNGISVLSANISTENQNRILLSTSEISTGEFEITISQVQAKDGPIISQFQSASFSYLQLESTEISALDENRILLVFNQEVQAATALNAGNYSISKGIGAPISVSFATGRQDAVVLTTALSMDFGENYSLSLADILNSSGNSQLEPVSLDFEVEIILRLLSVDVQSANSLLVVFNLDLVPSTANEPSHYQLLDAVGNSLGLPNVVNLQANAKMVLLEFPSALSSGEYLLRVNNLQESLSNSVIETDSEISFSYLALALNQLEVVSANELQLEFNQSIDLNSLNLKEVRVNNGIGNANNAQIGASENILLLNLEKAFSKNNYMLEIAAISNISGNARLNDLEEEFSFSVPIAFRQIVLNELFPDPNPKGLAPNPIVLPGDASDEFVELYNASDDFINIGDFTLRGRLIESFNLAPGAYVILTPMDKKGLYAAFGDVAGVSSWSQLPNASGEVVLKDHLGNTVDSLFYTSSWYKDNTKSNGGWSIEQINPLLPCSDINNWKATLSPQGGTPGQANSVLDLSPDVFAPQITSYRQQGDRSIVLLFNEIIDQASLSTAQLMSEPSLQLESISQGSNLFEVVFVFSSALQNNQRYTWQLSGISDCSGNVTSNLPFEFIFDTEPPVALFALFRDNNQVELIFDEAISSTGLVASKFDLDADTQPLQVQKVSGSDSIIRLDFAASFNLGQQYKLGYREIADRNGNLSAERSVLDFSPGREIDSVWVSADNIVGIRYVREPGSNATLPHLYHLDDGMGAPLAAVKDSDNPLLYRLVFERNLRTNRAFLLTVRGVLDSDNLPMQTPNLRFNNDRQAPRLEALRIISSRELELAFNEKVEVFSAEAVNNYEINQGIGFAIQAELLPSDSLVRLRFPKDFLQGVTHRLSILGVRDLSGNTITSRINTDFVYDTLAPSLAELRIQSERTLVLLASEPLLPASVLADSFALFPGGKQPTSVRLAPFNNRMVILDFAEDLGTDSLELRFSGWSDLRGNIQGLTQVARFSNALPQLFEALLIDENRLLLKYSKALDEDALDQAQLHVEDRAFTSIQVSGENSRTIDLTFTPSVTFGDSISIRTAGLKATDGSFSLAINTSPKYSPSVDFFRVAENNVLEINFFQSTPLSVTASPSAFSLDQGIGAALLVRRNPDNFRQLSVVFAQNLEDSLSYTLRYAPFRDIFDQWVSGGKLSFSIDRQPPQVLSLSVESATEILLTFNERLAAGSATATNHYTLEGSNLQPVSASLQSDQSSVLLRWEVPFLDGASNTLLVDRVQDLQGNRMQSQSVDFTFRAPYLAQYRDIVINEIMANEDAALGLPDFEYVELYNASSEAINLRGYTWSDRSRTVTLRAHIMEPGAYLILCPAAAESAFSTYGHSMGLSPWTTLVNSGDRLSLRNPAGELVDQVEYTDAWYRDNAKRGGGWSIEQISPEVSCVYPLNWIASISPGGGTPGAVNSVFVPFQSLSAPTLLSARVLGTDTIDLVFDRPMSEESLSTQVFRADGLIIKNIQFGQTGRHSIQLILDESVILGRSYFLFYNDGLKDCSGIAMPAGILEFGRGAQAAWNDLIVTEIMANPVPSRGLPESEYIEIYNRSSRVIDLAGMRLADNNSSTSIPGGLINPGEYVILCPNSQLSNFQSRGHAIGLSNWPGFNIRSDEVKLIGSSGDLVFFLSYTDAWYRSDEKRTGGNSLEMISLLDYCEEGSNWAGSNASSGGTPGSINSVNQNLAPRRGPSLLSAVAIADTLLELRFDQRVDILSLHPSQFAISPQLAIASLEPVAPAYKRLRLTLNTKMQVGVLYEIELGNMAGCNGNLIEQSARSAKFALPQSHQKGDIILNEVLFNARVGSEKFVELYNNSDKYINLKAWQLANANANSARLIINDDYILLPRDFVVITNSPGSVIAEYPAAKADKFIAMAAGLPSYPIREGTVVLLDPASEEQERLAYNENMHNSLLRDKRGVSLEKVKFDGPVNEAVNWQSASSTVNFATPGYMNSQAREGAEQVGTLTIDPQVFAPDNTGMQDFTTINYAFEENGNLGSIYIYDSYGRKIKTITENELLALQGYHIWDGTNDGGNRAKVGYYIVVMEIFNPSGQRKTFRERVVLGTRF